MSAQLTERFLPGFRIVRCGLEIQAVQRESTGLQTRVVAAHAVSVQHRAIWIGAASRWSLPHSPVLQNRQRDDQNHQGTRVKETLHRLQPIVLSATCRRTIMVMSTPVLSQKPYGENHTAPHRLEWRLQRAKWYRTSSKISPGGSHHIPAI